VQAIFWFHMDESGQDQTVRDTTRGFGHARRCVALARTWNQMTNQPAALMINRTKVAKEFAEASRMVWYFDDQADDVIHCHQPVILFADINYLDPVRLYSFGRLTLTVNLAPRGDVKYAAQLNFLDTRAEIDDTKRKNARGEIFAGPEYSVIDDDFIDRRRCIDRGDMFWRDRVITITMGGTDPWNFTLLAYKAIEGLLGEFEIQIVLGSAYSFDKDLERAISASGHRSEIYRNPASIADLLCRSTAAILAGGITALEALTLGVPSWNICPTRFHLKRCQEWQDHGVVQDARLDSDVTAGCWTSQLRDFCGDPQAVSKAREKSLGYIDGRGAARIVEMVQRRALLLAL
jgi:spore coat polysaccharide biosynthesis predicted glycosyltransferase SpsG